MRAATCHPDRLHHAKGLCKSCYNRPIAIRYIIKRVNRFLGLPVLLVALSLLGCGPVDTVTPAVSPAPSAPVVIPATIGATAPNFNGMDCNDRWFSLRDCRGRVVVVSFWGTFCRPCLAMIPHERAIAHKYSALDVVLVGVAVDADPNDAWLYVRTHRETITWPTLADAPTHAISDAYGVKALPTVFVIDRAGVVRHRIVGARPADLDAAIGVELARK